MMRIIILNILIFSFSFIKSNEIDIELETELFIQSTNSYGIKSNIYHNTHYSAFLRNLVKHGKQLSQGKKIALEALGFNTEGEFIKTSRPLLSNIIDDGFFRYHYNTVGTDAIDTTDVNSNNIPDYLDFIIKTFNEVGIINFDTLGFTYPPSDIWYTSTDNGGSSHYDIYIFNLDPGYYGYVQGESYSQNNSMINRGDNENSIDIKEKSSMVSFMAIRNNYSTFNGTIDEILQATISHEFFHAIQYGYDGWEAGWLLESTAVWMEELHYDHINDCYQFLEDNFNYPEYGLFKDTQTGYGSYIFFSYIEDNYLDASYVKHIFEKSIDYYSYDFDYSLDPVIDILASNSLDITNMITDLAISNLLLDGNAQPEIYQFEEANEYSGNGVYFSDNITTITDSVLSIDNESIWSTGNRFYEFINLDSTLESLTILLTDQNLNNDDYSLHTIRKLNNGSYDIKNGLSQKIFLSYNDTLLLSITYYNGYTLEPAQYSIKFVKNYLFNVDDEELSLNYNQNSKIIDLYSPYPNPFNGNTNINYYLSQPQNITIEIFNVRGQKIRDLINGYHTSGKYSVLWDSKDNDALAVPSGIYFTILQGGNTRLLNTITILK